MESLRTNWLAVLVLWLSGLGAAAQYGKVSVTYDSLSAFYPDAGANVGFLVSLIGVVGIVLGVVAGLIVARIGFRRTLICGLLGGAVVSLFQSSLPGFGWLAASRVIEGMSHLSIVVAAPTLMAQLSEDRHRGLTLTLWSTFFGVAFALLGWFGIPFVATHGLGALFGVHSGFMGACSLAVLLCIPKDLGDKGKVIPTLSQVIRDHGRIYRSANISAPALGWLFYTFSFVSLLTFLPPFLSAPTRIAVMGALPLVSIATSLLLGVWLLRYLRAVQVVQLGFVAGAGFALAVWLLPWTELWCFGLAAAMGLVQSASFAAVPELNPGAEGRAQSNGAMAQMGNLGNSLGTPVIAAMILPFGLTGLALPIIVALTLGALTHWALARRYS